jgi:Xaa-Pro aminopeptidase
MMTTTIQERLHSLRSLFDRAGIDSFIVPTSDPHLSEYTADYWKIRRWLSGFTGSAGTLVVLKDKAALWTDSRYFIQAARQLEGSGIELMKERLPETPSIPHYLQQNGCTNVGMDFRLLSARQMTAYLCFHIVDCPQLIEEIWSDRPALPASPAIIYNKVYAGKTAAEKISSIRESFSKRGADGMILSALDEIAWTLNLRGIDVHDVPVVISFLLITIDKVLFFISPDKLTPVVRTYLQEQGVEVHSYDEAYLQTELMRTYSKPILVDPTQTNFKMFNTLPSCLEYLSPVAMLKAVRNDCEIAGLRRAMQKDGVALVRFLKWLYEEALPSGKETELSIDKKLHTLRTAQPLYVGESFDTIAGYGEHAAIVHYSASAESDVTIRPQGFLLLDSGAQYLDGTTDITRTIALGELTDAEKTDYTLILKGHIDLASSVFPKGTTGGQLDAFARMPIWRHHKNYLHGTGHGVGHFLSVHEGPQSIRMEQNPIPLHPGMLTSDEPGVYLEGQYGIRIENLVLTRADGEGLFGDYYSFETVTLCPIDKTPIIKSMLTDDEVSWLNAYHQKVYDLLSPSLDDDERAWLREATSAL